MVKKVGYLRPRITSWGDRWLGFPTRTLVYHPIQDLSSIRERHNRDYMKMNPKGFGYKQRKYIRRRG